MKKIFIFWSQSLHEGQSNLLTVRPEVQICLRQIRKYIFFINKGPSEAADFFFFLVPNMWQHFWTWGLCDHCQRQNHWHNTAKTSYPVEVESAGGGESFDDFRVAEMRGSPSYPGISRTEAPASTAAINRQWRQPWLSSLTWFLPSLQKKKKNDQERFQVTVIVYSFWRRRWCVSGDGRADLGLTFCTGREESDRV